MKELVLGKISSQDLASWFGVTYNTYRHQTTKYQEQLKEYCDFVKCYGGVEVKEIYNPIYNEPKKIIEDKKLYLKEVEDCIKKQDGLATISGMSRKYVQIGVYENENTARRRLSKAGEELFGSTKELLSHGEAGIREYVWAIKVNDYNIYRAMTPEEEKRFDEIISTCYSENPEKVRQAGLLQDALRAKEISVDEFFEKQDRLGLDTFKDCIFKFKDETGDMIVRCTRHELMQFFEE